VTGDSLNPEQPPSGPLSARESASTPAAGPSRGTGGPSGPQTGAQRLESRPTTLRERFAAAIASYDHAVGQATDPAPSDHHHGQADAVLAVRDRELEQLRTRHTETRDALRITEGDRDAADEAAREMLTQRQEMAAERYAWQERGDKAEAALERVRAECDRIEAAVRARPTAPDFDGAYLAAIGHIRAALNPQEAQ